MAGLVGTHPAPRLQAGLAGTSLQDCSPPPPTQSSHLSLAALQNPFLSQPSVPAWLLGCWILEGNRPLCPSGLPTRKSWAVIPGGACKGGESLSKSPTRKPPGPAPARCQDPRKKGGQDAHGGDWGADGCQEPDWRTSRLLGFGIGG